MASYVIFPLSLIGHARKANSNSHADLTNSTGHIFSQGPIRDAYEIEPLITKIDWNVYEKS